MNSLYARLSIALLLLVALMGGAFYLVERNTAAAYYEELTQRLNAPIAMYVTEQRQLIRDGVPDIESLRDLANHAMVINPSAEIYLLDADGRILGHSMPEETVLKDRVDLVPVTALMDATAAMPLRGDDPRSGSSRKVFSAAPVVDNGTTVGYLYVVLGGKTYEALASSVGGSYVGKVTLLALALIVLAGALLGLVVVSLLTRRLKRLRSEMQAASETGFSKTPSLWDTPTRGGDEIDDLANAFSAMSRHIAMQIDQLRENDRLRRELVSNISHDLRTPLAAMQGYIETLIIKDESLGASLRQRYLRIARKHTVRLGTLIGDLFELSKLDATHASPNLESFSLQELAHDVMQEFQIAADQRSIDLNIQFDENSPPTVGDIGLIQRVLENLVRNAVMFTPAGGEVTLSIAGNPEHVAISVTDTGPGIAEADLPRIFDRFYRAVDGEEARADSSGLGLAIVKRILDLHDTRITVSSRLDVGTRFEFELPAARQAA